MMTPGRLLLAVLLASVPSWVAAQEPIGTAIRIVNKVTADQTPLATGDGVAQNQTIEVAPNFLGELRLKDETLVAVGAGGRLVLDKFVYDPAKSSEDIAVRLVGGAFRFITGTASKRAYKITTPSSALSRARHDVRRLHRPRRQRMAAAACRVGRGLRHPRTVKKGCAASCEIRAMSCGSRPIKAWARRVCSAPPLAIRPCRLKWRFPLSRTHPLRPMTYCIHASRSRRGNARGPMNSRACARIIR